MFGPRPLVPREFEIPLRVETDQFVLRPLTVDRFHLDYESYMSSVEHLQQTFDLDGDPIITGEQVWPAGSDLEFALVDAAWCHMEWKYFRSSFTYSALDLAETRQLGCGYVYPCHKEGYDVLCETWVRADQLERGFDDEFSAWFRNWVEAEWPFEPDRVGWPGRSISWGEWNALPEKP
jgi:hypothetical protein